MTGEQVAATWAAVEAILDRPPVRRLAGQLAAFDVEELAATVEPVAPRQLGLFDPEVIA